MTALRARAASNRHGNPAVRRLVAATRAEIRTAWRYGVVGLAGGLALLWSLALLALPPAGARMLLPLLLLVDTAGFGALIAVALALFERVERTDAARGVTPLRPWETVAARVTVLTVLAVAMAVPMTLASGVPVGPGGVAAIAGGVAMTSVLLVGTCLALGSGAATLSAAFLRVVPGVVLLIVAPVLHLSEAVRAPVLFLVPSTAAAELLRVGATGGAPAYPSTLWALAWGTAGAVGACAWAARGMNPPIGAPRGRPVFRRGPEPGARTGPGAAGVGAAFSGRARRRSPLLSCVRFDLSAGRGDPLLPVVLFAPVLLALLIRVGHPPVSAFVRDSYGFDLASVAPVVFAALILLHVPLIAGSVVALRLMEDVDDRTLLVLRASPLPLYWYVGYRSGLAWLLSLVGLAAAVPLSGLAPPWSAGLAVSVAVAAAAAPLLVLTVTSTASNKVEALVVVKAVAALSVLLPVLAWTLPAPVVWVLLAVPPGWGLFALPGLPVPELPPVAVLLGGLLWTLALCLVAARRTGAKLEL
ncbi:hypothetical protein GCM10009551_062220 [Nocardiopsis tropica]